MSAAIDFPPLVDVPQRARPRRGLALVPAPSRPAPSAERRLADVVVLVPVGLSEPRPVRLTHRGRVALAVLVGVISLALVGIAWLSAPPAAPHVGSMPTTVTVHGGDTLWAVAQQIAPNSDPRAVVDNLVRINHLSTDTLYPGQILRTR